MTGRTFSLAADPCLADHALDGTPLVPFALAVGELLGAAQATALDAFAIELPLFLRRNRDKVVSVIHDGESVALADGNGVVHARALAAGAPAPPASTGPSCTRRECPYRLAAPDATRGPRSSGVGCASGGMALGRRLYESVFFHGPSFQVDWALRAVHPRGLAACLSDVHPEGTVFARYPWNLAFPVLLADLALQAAGLHFALAEDRFGVPEACDRVAGFGTGPGPHTVRVSLRENVRDLIVCDDGGQPELVLTGLRFRPVERPLPATVLALLDEVKRQRGYV